MTIIYKRLCLVGRTHSIIRPDSSQIQVKIEFLKYCFISTYPIYCYGRNKQDSVDNESFDGYAGADGIVLNSQHTSKSQNYIHQACFYTNSTLIS
jgi:hypothetical protein